VICWANLKPEEPMRRWTLKGRGNVVALLVVGFLICWLMVAIIDPEPYGCWARFGVGCRSPNTQVASVSLQDAGAATRASKRQAAAPKRDTATVASNSNAAAQKETEPAAKEAADELKPENDLADQAAEIAVLKTQLAEARSELRALRAGTAAQAADCETAPAQAAPNRGKTLLQIAREKNKTIILSSKH